MIVLVICMFVFMCIFGLYCGICDVDFEVVLGEVFGFFGLNGAGKLMMIWILMGLIWLMLGEV